MENWQKLHIEKNLDKLIAETQCNIHLLTILRKENVLSQVDVETVDCKNIPMEKASTLYSILKTRTNAYEILKTALQNTSQSGVLAVLQQTPTNYKDYGSIAVNKECVIGRGCYNTKVYKGIFGERDVAVKVINTDDIPSDVIHREIGILKQLDYHQNIVRYFTAEKKFDYVYIALELCVGNLHQWVDNNFVNISEQEILRQSTEGLIHLHSNKLIHRDLKPVNILLTDNSIAKISDFGLSKRIPLEHTSVTAHSLGIGTEGWMAPEVLRFGLMAESHIKLKTATDIFSLGCIFYFVLTGGDHLFGPPWKRQGNIIEDNPCFDEIDQKKKVPPICISLIKEMISNDPNHRPSAETVSCSKYFSPFEKKGVSKEFKGKPAQSSVNTLSAIEEMAPVFANVAHGKVQKTVNFKKMTILEEKDGIEKEGSTEPGLNLRFESISLQPKNTLQVQKESEAGPPPKNKGKFGLNLAGIEKVTLVYRKQMDSEFESNIKPGYFTAEELKQIDTESRTLAQKKFFSGRALQEAIQWEEVEIFLNQLFGKYEDINNAIERAVENTKEVAVGIYLGSQYCLMSYIVSKVRFKNKYLMAYAFIKSNGSVITGFIASKKLDKYQKETVYGFKRIIGCRMRDEQLKKDMTAEHWQFSLEEKDGKAQFKVRDRYYPPEDLLANVIIDLRNGVELEGKIKVTKAVITAPLYFTSFQRKALQDAVEMTGIKVLGMLSDVHAAALYYQLDWDALVCTRKALIYNLAQRTCDVTILQISHDKIDLIGNICDLNFKINNTSGEMFDMVTKSLESAGLKEDEIDDVVLTGGSTKIPTLLEKFKDHFHGAKIFYDSPQNVQHEIYANYIKSRGAAIQAAIMNAKPEKQLFDFKNK